jgi:hypothetical protein
MYNNDYIVRTVIEGKQYALFEKHEGQEVFHGKFESHEEALSFVQSIEEARAVFRGDYAG